MAQYSYSINESTNEMTIWEDNCTMCTISDIVDDENIILLDSGLVAELIKENDFIH